MSKAKGKSEASGPAPLLGRVGTSLKVGIVGLPNVGFVYVEQKPCISMI